MTETTNTQAEPRDQAQDTVAIGASTMCHDLVAMLLGELRNMPAAWTALASDRQEKILDAMKVKVREAVDKAVAIMLRSEFPAVEAELDSVSRNKTFRARLTIKPDALFRASLVDAVGAKVLVVIADPKRWVERMDELKVKGDQADLFDPAANYDPSVDQPRYRRDQDPLAPAGKSWADLKKDLTGSGKDVGEVPPADVPTQDKVAEEKGESSADPATVDLIQLQAGLLSDTGTAVSLGFLKRQAPEEITRCGHWLAFYTGEWKPGTADEIPDRPEWLPLPSSK